MPNEASTMRHAIFALVTGYMLFLNGAYANPVPGLHWPTAVKEATHVVLASEGETIECWKGDLHPGDVLEIPESRLIEGGTGLLPLNMVTGNRMILFLKKKQVWADWKKTSLKTKWIPAPGFPEPSYMHPGPDAWMRIGVVWIEDGKLCAYFVGIIGRDSRFHTT